MVSLLVAGLRESALILLPLAVIAAARALTYTDWAAANATLAALLFAWIVADGLAFSTIAKAPGYKPGLKPMLGALAAASVVAPVLAAAPVRAALLSIPPLLAAMGLTLVLYLGWSGAQAIATWRRSRSVERTLSQILPAPLVRMLLAELRMMHLALFRWNAPADVPSGALAFSYHRYLVPMLATLLALQAIELVVVHWLVSLWSPTVALVLLALSVGGMLWFVALMKSFRINPVLLTDSAIRVRSGVIVDAAIPLEAVAGLADGFTAAELKRKTTLNTAILSAPNICVELVFPIGIPTLFGRRRLVDRVAMRLEDATAFRSALEKRLG